MPRVTPSMPRVLGALLVVSGVSGLVGCSAGEPETALTESSQTVAAFYGDSYTHGAGASERTLRWSSQISEQRNWIEVNPSVPGLGFVNNREALPDDLVGLIVAEKPDVVIVTMGLNDNFLPADAAGDIEKAIADDLETFADELPDAHIVVVEPFWYTDERPESVDTIIEWVKEGAAEVDADYIAGASRWLEGHPEWMASDGIHPNDAGYAEITERMDEELSELGL